MSATILFLLGAIVAGLPVSARARHRDGVAAVAGASLLTGLGFIAVVMLVVSLAGLKWSVPAIVAGVAILAIGSVAAIPPDRRSAIARQTPTAVEMVGSICVDLLVLVLVGGHLLYVTSANLWEWDFTGIWGLKGATFLADGGVDLRDLSESFSFSHPDYPPLLPLLYAGIGLIRGGWGESGLAIAGSAAAIASLLVIRAELRRRLRRRVLVSLGTLALTSAMFDVPVGLADGLLLAFLAPAILSIAGSGDPADRGDFLGWIWLGFAALTKNEGIAAIVAVGIVFAIARRRLLLRIVIAATIAMLWIVPRAVYGLATDLSTGDPLTRISANVYQLGTVIFATPPAHWIQWSIAVAALVTSWRFVGSDRWILSFAVIQTVFYLGAYLVTPHDVSWHVMTSWPRLTMHLLPLVVVVVMTSLARSLAWTREDAAGEEISVRA